MKAPTRKTLSMVVVAAIVAFVLAVHMTEAQTTATKPAEKPTREQIAEARLDEIARIASVLVDGELCLHIVTDRAEQLMFKPDPRDPYAGADNYDVNIEPFMQTKKLLARLALLAEFPADCNLIMRSKVRPEKI